MYGSQCALRKNKTQTKSVSSDQLLRLCVKSLTVGPGLQRLLVRRLLEHGFGLRLLLLQGPHPRVFPLCFKQLSVAATLDDATLLEHEDLVRVHHGREPVSDY